MDSDINAYYLGTAHVQRRHLNYAERAGQPDDCIGCCITDTEHHLPALIADSDLKHALHQSGVEEYELYHFASHPKLQLSVTTTLPCLHGRYRLQNTTVRQDSWDEWWLVDLYSSGTAILHVGAS